MPPGSDLLVGAVDNHIHACPHLNGRSVDVFDAVRQAQAAGMRGIGLMDNFANSSGYAALARGQLADTSVDVFGGVILEPQAGGVTLEAVEIALGYGYGPETGARFVSMPTHHTRNIARQEGRSPAYIDSCFYVPEDGPLPDPLPAILDAVASAGVVLNTGHITGAEAVRLTREARQRGVERILAPCSHFEPDAVAAITEAGGYAEFSFFFVSHATQVGLTHVDSEKHQVASVSLGRMQQLIRAARPERTVVSSDCGVFVLPPPAEGLREFLLLLQSVGFSAAELRQMSGANPAYLFQVDRA